MNKNLILTVLLAGSLVVPSAAHASIVDDLLGAVRGLQKQVSDLISIRIDLNRNLSVKTVQADKWLVHQDTAGYSVEYPRDWATTTIFSVFPEYKNSTAFVRGAREDFLKKILKPGTLSVDLAVQDSAVFFSTATSGEMKIKLAQLDGKVSTSTKTIGSTTALYILHSAKTDPEKFGGGSTEQYILSNGSTTIIAESNYSSDVPTGVGKNVFDKMLSTFKFTGTGTTTGTSTEMVGTTTATSSGTVLGTSTEQLAI